MSNSSRFVGVVLGCAAFSTVAPVVLAAPEPTRVPTLRSLDIELDHPESNLEISGLSPGGPVVLTGSVLGPSRPEFVEEAHGPLIEAFLMSETAAGPGRCRWIAGWADLTARGIFHDAGEGTLAGVSGLDCGPVVDRSDDSSNPRWYLAFQPL